MKRKRTRFDAPIWDVDSWEMVHRRLNKWIDSGSIVNTVYNKAKKYCIKAQENNNNPPQKIEWWIGKVTLRWIDPDNVVEFS